MIHQITITIQTIYLFLARKITVKVYKVYNFHTYYIPKFKIIIC